MIYKPSLQIYILLYHRYMHIWIYIYLWIIHRYSISYPETFNKAIKHSVRNIYFLFFILSLFYLILSTGIIVDRVEVGDHVHADVQEQQEEHQLRRHLEIITI